MTETLSQPSEADIQIANLFNAALDSAERLLQANSGDTRAKLETQPLAKLVQNKKVSSWKAFYCR